MAYLLTGDSDRAGDVTQEAFVRMLGRFHHLRNPEAFEGYLRRTLVNLVRSEWSRRKREGTRVVIEEAHATPAATGDADARATLLDALAKLPQRQRTAIVLRYYGDLTESSAAAAMSCSTDSVKALVKRGLATLRKELGGGFDG